MAPCPSIAICRQIVRVANVGIVIIIQGLRD